MKILEITNYTSGGCGVGNRVISESKILASKGHKVTIFSTNIVKGTNKLCPSYEKLDGVEIKRFHANKLGGESYMLWNFEKEAIKLKPDVIIVHAYRHIHTTKALKLSKSLNCKIFLVTHAPFDRSSSRSILGRFAVKMYDLLVGKNTLKKFSKVITITKWERKYLENLGLSNKNLIYIPNGIDKDFFKPINLKKINKNPQIVYLGRISPIKQIETLILASSYLMIKSIIIGPAEENYLKKLHDLVKSSNSKSEIINKIYDRKEQIKILDFSDIFVLPSKSEGLPQTLLEAMARGKIVVASDSLATRDVIRNQKNGFLYKNGDPKSLAATLKLINSLTDRQIKKIRKDARKTAEDYKWGNLLKKINSLIK